MAATVYHQATMLKPRTAIDSGWRQRFASGSTQQLSQLCHCPVDALDASGSHHDVVVGYLKRVILAAERCVVHNLKHSAVGMSNGQTDAGALLHEHSHRFGSITPLGWHAESICPTRLHHRCTCLDKRKQRNDKAKQDGSGCSLDVHWS